MNNVNEEEQKYFDYTITSLKKEQDYYHEQMKEIPKKYTNTLQGDAFLVENLMSITATRLRQLELAKKSPYFGRIDFLTNGNGNIAKIYIGKTNINGENNKQIVTDWRAPICSLYYDSDLGLASYDTPIGEIYGDLKLKRQIIIKDGKLIDVFDTNIVSTDELLYPYLKVNAGTKMKTIISSIQKEQNRIIRKPFSSNIIVQGVAGSGKTSVALHRVAYLIYNLKDKIKSNQFMILGPNNCFLEYISSILPELDTEPVNQKTFIELTNDLIGEKLTIINESDIFNSKDSVSLKNIHAFKTSLEYKKALKKFIYNYIENFIVPNDFILDGETIFSAEIIKKILFSTSNSKPSFEKAYNYFVNYFKENIDNIYDTLNEKYRKIYISLPIGNPIRQEAIEKSTKLKNLVKNNGINILRDYFKKLKLKITDIYKLFIENIKDYSDYLTDSEIEKLQKNTILYLKKKKVSFSDLPALLYINYILYNKKFDYKHIIIDEAQDYGFFHFDILKNLFSDCTFSIYGDLAQSIHSYRSINDWESVISNIFDGNCEIIKLNKSYRTTTEITNNANKILYQMNMDIANPVIRHGCSVKFSENSKNNEYKINRINELIKKGYKTIAIICKTEKESLNVYNSLKKSNINVIHITGKQTKYNENVVVLTSELSKGLEFDAVIINNASNNIYSKESKIDMNLLYVASTRALHELEILYEKQICDVFNDINTIKHKTLKKQIIKSENIYNR